MYSYAENAQDLFEFVSIIVKVTVEIEEGDWVGVVQSLVGVDPSEIDDIFENLKDKALDIAGLDALISAAAAAPIIPFKVNFPDKAKNGKKASKIGEAFRLADSILGKVAGAEPPGAL